MWGLPGAENALFLDPSAGYTGVCSLCKSSWRLILMTHFLKYVVIQ